MSDQDRAYYRIKEEPVTTCATCAENDAERMERQHIADILVFGMIFAVLVFGVVGAIRSFFEWRSRR